MKFATKSILVVSTLLSASAVMAQSKAPEPDYTLAYNVAAVTDYRVRGISQTAFKPALQAGVDFAHKSGLYLGAFGSNVSWIKDFNLATKGSVEIDLYGGFKGAITKDIGFDVGVITYQYPGNNSGAAGTPGAGAFSNANTTEIYGALSYSVFNLKYSRSVGDFLGNLNSSGSQYIDLNANFDLGNGFTLTPHVGRQTIPNQGPGGNLADCTDYSLAIAKDMGNGLILTAAAVGTNGNRAFYTDSNGKFLAKSGVLVGVKYNF
ncbi:TorF family putative porin [Polaromonas sp.]|jgi:uncharacterized protein (TIGR02001 family)|uniref:TorF family putative porin n=1 Tax=Polaromonas sp. TaxID=1869339 RepID=UPI002BE7B154|nr:TorF family putative porin [Polaromonas sp.]HQS30400.1 TorF family putative porin [Polaromonas sp.]HQS90340.1 TorF family putative porin [Polaromonas sp.]